MKRLYAVSKGEVLEKATIQTEQVQFNKKVHGIEGAFHEKMRSTLGFETGTLKEVWWRSIALARFHLMHRLFTRHHVRHAPGKGN